LLLDLEEESKGGGIIEEQAEEEELKAEDLMFPDKRPRAVIAPQLKSQPLQIAKTEKPFRSDLLC